MFNFFKLSKIKIAIAFALLLAILGFFTNAATMRNALGHGIVSGFAASILWAAYYLVQWVKHKIFSKSKEAPRQASYIAKSSPKFRECLSLPYLKVRHQYFHLTSSGWGRIFLVLWAIWISFLGYRYWEYENAISTGQELAGYVNEWGYKAAVAREEGHQDVEELSVGTMNEFKEQQANNSRQIGRLDNADWHFYLWGILAPILGCMATIWIVVGFRKQVPRSSSDI